VLKRDGSKIFPFSKAPDGSWCIFQIEGITSVPARIYDFRSTSLSCGDGKGTYPHILPFVIFRCNMRESEGSYRKPTQRLLDECEERWQTGQIRKLGRATSWTKNGVQLCLCDLHQFRVAKTDEDKAVDHSRRRLSSATS
jgi:hypothetical protein